jgi:hypothetical protein
MHALNAFVDCVKNASMSLSASTLEVGHQGVHGATALAANSSLSNWISDEYSLVRFYLFFFAISSFLRFFFFSLSRIYGVTTHDTASTVALNKGCYRTCRRRSDWILHRLLANHPANQWVGMLLC